MSSPIGSADGGAPVPAAPPSGPSAVSSRRREPGWDLLRGGFVMLVVLYHATYLGPVLYPDLLPRRFVFPHQVGSSLLLVISAYFACATLGRSTPRRYWWGRVARLVPAFVVVVPVAWALLRYGGPEHWWTPGRRDLVFNWLMLGNWEPSRFPYLDGSYWTLPLQLMAFTAAAVLSATRWGRGRRLRIVMWTAVLVPLAQWPYRVFGPPEPYRILVDGFGFHRLHLFVAGVAIWLWSGRRLGGVHAAALLAACAGAQFAHAVVLTPAGELDEDWLGTLGVCAGIVAVAVVARAPRCGRLAPGPLEAAGRWLAGISYGVYLVHQTVGYVLMRRLQDLGIGPTLQSAAMVVSAVVLGWALTTTVERPAHQALLRAYDGLADRRDGPGRPTHAPERETADRQS